MNIFDTHNKIVKDYSKYIRSFIKISDPQINQKVEESLSEGRLWPEPLLQFNPAYEQAGTIEDAVSSGLLHDDMQHIFAGYSLYRHQHQAIELGVRGNDFVVTSGTGSGKSLTYIGTIINSLLCKPASEGVVAVIVYPMNALINSQSNEFKTYKNNYENHKGGDFPITFGQYTSQEKEEKRNAMRENPPRILLTNYMMLELILTRMQEKPIRDSIFNNLRYLVFDELHTYRGRQGADISMLIRRIQSQCTQRICCIGTSATMVSTGSTASKRQEVAQVASKIFGRPFKYDQVIDETLTSSLAAAAPPSAKRFPGKNSKLPYKLKLMLRQMRTHCATTLWRSGWREILLSMNVTGGWYGARPWASAMLSRSYPTTLVYQNLSAVKFLKILCNG